MDSDPESGSPSPTVTHGDTDATVAALMCETTISIGGVLSFGPGIPETTLTHAALLETPCAPGQTPTSTGLPEVITSNGVDGSISRAEAADSGPQFSAFRDPFYASIYPVCYVLAATTVTAYMLVIMLFITPRSFLDGGIVYLGRRGFTSGSSGGITIGGRPWLQKVAAMTVAISLTIATADTFRVVEEQYSWGVQNADKLQSEVMDSTELKVIRLVSDTFLWLAQAQTLIRLFPRQREKVIIKWTAFALITLQVIFSALNSFYYTTSGSQGNARPQSFVHAVPALSYLFHLSLGLLYAAWVIYYSLMKKRYAFYHPLMKNMILVSTLSLLSILVPVVFFILDISRPEFIGWGDYVRWVGAAAASVVVWEWVERIEALEREEKKDGILGREVFEGDEMMEVSASEFPWLRRRKNRKGPHGGDGGGDGGGGGGQGVPGAGVLGAEDANVRAQGTTTGTRIMAWPGLTSIPPQYQGNFQHQQQGRARNAEVSQSARHSASGGILRPALWPSRPAPVATPASRTETASAASTDYAVRYQPISETTGRTPDGRTPDHHAQRQSQQQHRRSSHQQPPPNVTRQHSRTTPTSTRPESSSSDGGDRPGSSDTRPAVAAPIPRQATNAGVLDPEAQEPATENRNRWRSLTSLTNPFTRWGVPQEGEDGEEGVSASAATASSSPNRATPKHEARQREGYESNGRWDFKARFEDFAASQAEKIREKMQSTPETDSLPVTVIPAPPRQGAALAQLLEEEAADEQRGPRTEGAQHSQVQAQRLQRTASEASEFSSFPGFGNTVSGMRRTTSNYSHISPEASHSTDTPVLGPHQPPLWPGVQAHYEYDEISDTPTPTSYHPRRPADDVRSPPTP